MMSDDTQFNGLRQEIDGIDDAILALLNRRAACSIRIGAIKAKSGGAVFRPGREQMLMEKLLAANPGPLPEEHLRGIYREILSSSRALQRPLRVAYLGPEGTFSHMAGLEFFGEALHFTPMPHLSDIFQAVENHSVDLGIVPLENSLNGAVGQSIDLFAGHEVHISAEWFSRISHSLMSREKSLAAVKAVYSHAQALGQCSEWLRKNLPNARQVSLESTAAAAHKALAEDGAAAVGHGALAARLGLSVLAGGIEDSADNWTRFCSISSGPVRRDTASGSIFCSGHVPKEYIPAAKNLPSLSDDEQNPCCVPGHCDADKTSVLFSVADKPGSLAAVLQCLGASNVNMSKLESRPLRTERWKYVFFADLDCDLTGPDHAALVEKLRGICHSFRILGAYSKGRNIS